MTTCVPLCKSSCNSSLGVHNDAHLMLIPTKSLPRYRALYMQEDIGFMYAVTAGRQDGSGSGASGGAPQVVTGRGTGRGTERDAPYVPTTAPGARLPHALLTDTGGHHAGRSNAHLC